MILDLTTHSILRLQALQQGQQRAATNFFAVGSDLYYVMRRQLTDQFTDPDYNQCSVWKSSDKVTWSLVATATESNSSPQDNFTVDCPACLVGTKIYILLAQDSAGVKTLKSHIFDTSTDTFAANSSISDAKLTFLQENGYSVCAFNNGKLLVSSSAVNTGATVGLFEVQLYTPGTDTWGAPVTVDTVGSSAASQIVQQIHDPGSDLAFLFYRYRNTQEMRCATVDNTVSFSDVTVYTFPVGDPNPAGNGVIGQPILTTDTGEVVLPWFYRIPVGGTGFNGVKAARAPIAGTPTFSVDVVEDNSTLGGTNSAQGWDQQDGASLMCRDIGGLLYCFYAVDNGDLDSSSSQCWLYYRWSTAPGTWSAPQIVFTSVVPGEMLIPYGSLLADADPIILVGIVNPTTYPDVASMTSFILFPADELSNEFL